MSFIKELVPSQFEAFDWTIWAAFSLLRQIQSLCCSEHHLGRPFAISEAPGPEYLPQVRLLRTFVGLES